MPSEPPPSKRDLYLNKLVHRLAGVPFSQQYMESTLSANAGIAALSGVIASAEGRPTRQAYVVLDTLSKELDVQLRAPDPATADTTDTRLHDGLTTLRADVLAGRVNPGTVDIVRTLGQLF
mgnify:CR=1 FL=1